MNLTYRILWIEDNEDYVDALNQVYLQTHVQDHGFNLDLKFRISPEEIALDVDGSEFDLMVIDYHITEDNDLSNNGLIDDKDEKTGDKVIQAVREHDCLTEVIFYSGKPRNELRQIAADRELEGVFFSDRDPDVLLKKVCDVFDLTVRKVVDVNNMRGIVMAGVADLDHQLSDLLLELHNQLDVEGKNKHHKKLFQQMLRKERTIKKLVENPEDDLMKEMFKSINALKNLAPKKIEELIEEREFDSHSRVEAAASLCNNHENLVNEKAKLDEIKYLLKWRNALAHQRPRIDENGVQLFEPTKDQPEAFDETRTRDLRKKLREHSFHLEHILKRVRGE